MSTTNGNHTTICSVPGCHVRAHGRELCRVHYDRKRYQETTRETAEDRRAHARERSVRTQLNSGSPSIFTSEDEYREAWEAHRDELLAKPSRRPRLRPAAWWHFIAERPERVLPYPSLDLDDPQDERAEMLDEYEIEPVEWLAANGYLTDEEVSTLAEEAREARARIGTPAERIGSGGVDRADRRRVKLYEAVERALEDD